MNHLVILTTQIALNAQGNTRLFADIKATYDRLNSQSSEDLSLHLGPVRNAAIWLNVHDPLTDNWVWRSASELVFDLQFDENGKYDVKDFLVPYKNMLINGGGREFKHATYKGKDDQHDLTYTETLQIGWDNLRRSEKLTDVHFVTADGKHHVKAHRGMMAAMVPHFNQAFTGDWSESQDASQHNPIEYELPKNVSLFCIEAVVGV